MKQIITPKGYIRLGEACEQVADRLYPGERPVRPDSLAIIQRELQRLEQEGTDPEKAAAQATQFANEAQGLFIERDAAQREAAFDWIRETVVAGGLKTQAQIAIGEIIDIPAHVWAGPECQQIRNTHRAVVRFGRRAATGAVLVWQADLEQVLPKRSSISSAHGAYVPPYLKFMLRAAEALDASEERRLIKEEVCAWLQKHWPTELGPCSDNKIQFMATFLRNPRDEKGGIVAGAQVRNRKKG